MLFTFYSCPYQICFSFLGLFLNTRLVLLLTNGLIPTMSLHDHRSGVFSQINCGPSNHDPWSHKMFLPSIIWQEESLIFYYTTRNLSLEQINWIYSGKSNLTSYSESPNLQANGVGLELGHGFWNVTVYTHMCCLLLLVGLMWPKRCQTFDRVIG